MSTYEVVQYNDKGDCYVNLHFPDYKFYGKEQFQFALVNAGVCEDLGFLQRLQHRQHPEG